MSGKTRIIEVLGEAGLRLPALVNAALAANDRAKYFFMLLQLAGAHASAPHELHDSARGERLAADVADASLDAVVAGSSLEDGRLRIPRVAHLCRQLCEAVENMLEPLAASRDPQYDSYAARYAGLREQAATEDDEHIAPAAIAAMASGDRQHGDSLHLLVMDLHKALNALQARIAEEHIDGASCYQIDDADRPLIAAFMRGINRTRGLKFDHPGLDTTATRSGARLVLQNDIGTTDAHVLVVHVEAMRVSITYTDVHLQRLLFFQQLFERWSMAWEDTRSRSDPSLEDGLYHMSIGRYTASSAAELDRFLAFLGSRLVFLIDWNRARKRLRLLLPKREAMALLKWAADNDLGHMAFLKAEATHLIFDALGFLSRGNLSLGTRLDDLLGSEPSCEYMQFVFRICSEGLAAGRPENFIQDEIRAELSNYFQSASQSLLDVAAEHAALSIEIACGIRDCLLHAGEATAAEQIALNARRAKHWEHEADELVNRARTTIRQNDRGAFFRSLVESADDIADELEEAAFHLTLIGPGASPRLLAPLGNLAGLLVAGSQEYLKALETAVGLRRGSPREDVQDFLAAVHRISANEQASDLVQREVKVALMGAQIDARQLYAFSECARNLEAAADALMHVGLALRDHVLGDVMAG